LVIARNHTSLNWVLELLPSLVSDTRIELLFSVPKTGTSVWARGVHTDLNEQDILTIPWKSALRTRFDLAIAATHRGDLDRMRSPLLLLPHGPGYTRVSSVRPDWTIPIPNRAAPTNRSVPLSTVVLSHPKQKEQFNVSPDASLAVAGDPCWDSLVASQARRSWYRRAFAVGDHQHFVLITSTWGEGSLFGSHGTIIDRVVGDLPIDRYQLGLVLHPNIWAAHGAWQIRAWLDRALRSGLRLLSPDRAWRAGVVAADNIIGDHGSVSLYGAALGRPVLLAAYAKREVVRGTGVERLADLAPHFSHQSSIESQIQQSVDTWGESQSLELRSSLFACEGEAHAIHRALLYDLLDLEQPSFPVLVPMVPWPEFESKEPIAWSVFGAPIDDSNGIFVSLDRRPVFIPVSDVVAGQRSHLAAFTHCDDLRVLQSASVLLSEEGETSPRQRLQQIMADYPNCKVAGVVIAPSRWLLLVRDGPTLSATIESLGAGYDDSAAVSALYLLGLHYRWNLVGVESFGVTLAKRRSLSVRLRPSP
jgi:hypothetical protein